MEECKMNILTNFEINKTIIKLRKNERLVCYEMNNQLLKAFMLI